MIVEFHAPMHGHMLRAWKEARGQEWRPQDLPPLGWVCDDVAAMWLMRTDTTRAQIDSIVSDPGAPPIVAGRAVQRLFWHATAVAKDLGYRYLEGYSEVRGEHAFVRRVGGSSGGTYAYLRRPT